MGCCNLCLKLCKQSSALLTQTLNVRLAEFMGLSVFDKKENKYEILLLIVFLFCLCIDAFYQCSGACVSSCVV